MQTFFIRDKVYASFLYTNFLYTVQNYLVTKFYRDKVLRNLIILYLNIKRFVTKGYLSRNQFIYYEEVAKAIFS
jgi:hypothetical protein